MVLNFANCDMVGHTGILEAAIRAVEAVDRNVRRVVEKVWEIGGVALVTADHGNAETMIDPKTGGPHTAHTTNLVPLVLADPRARGEAPPGGSRPRGRRPDHAEPAVAAGPFLDDRDRRPGGMR